MIKPENTTACLSLSLCFFYIFFSLPFLIIKDELPQLEVSENQAVVVAVCHGGHYLIEESGSLFLPQLLASADKRVHVSMAPLEEHVSPRVSKEDLYYLVDVLMSTQYKVGS